MYNESCLSLTSTPLLSNGRERGWQGVGALAAVVQLKFERVYLQAHFFDFLSFEFDVAFEQVVAENVALFEEGIVGFERVQRLFQREGDLRDVVRFFRRQVVEVFVHRLAQPGGGKSGGSAITPGKPQRRRTHGGERDDWRVVVRGFCRIGCLHTG